MKSIFAGVGFTGRIETHIVRRGAAKDLAKLPINASKRPHKCVAYAIGHSRKNMAVTNAYAGDTMEAFGTMKMGLPPPDPWYERV